MSHEPTRTRGYATKIPRTTASAAKYAVRALAQSVAAREAEEMSHAEVAALAAELREIFTSSQEALSGLCRAATDQETCDNLRDAQRFAEDAARIIGYSFPTEEFPSSGDQYTRITKPGEIEALTPGRELTVGSLAFRVYQLPGAPIAVTSLDGEGIWTPEDFIEQFRGSLYRVLLRH